MPSLTTLLSNSSGKSLSNIAPVLCSKLLDIFSKLSIFLSAPRTLNHHRIENLLPPVQALHVSPVRKVLSNLLPILGSIFIYQFSELFVFLFIPVSFVVLRILRTYVHLHDLCLLHVWHLLISKGWRHVITSFLIKMLFHVLVNLILGEITWFWSSVKVECWVSIWLVDSFTRWVLHRHVLQVTNLILSFHCRGRSLCQVRMTRSKFGLSLMLKNCWRFILPMSVGFGIAHTWV